MPDRRPGPTAADPERRVLLLGYRAGIARALRDAGLPFVIWSEAPLKVPPRGVPLHVRPFGRRAADSRRQAQALLAAGPFTHVIAGTEAAVVPASHARRIFSARRSTHTTVRRCHDKLAMKTELLKHAIPMTAFIDGNKKDAELLRRLGAPLVVKDRHSSGGRGIDFVDPAEAERLRLANRIVERFVDAPEASVESFVQDGVVAFENFTEYHRTGRINVVPAKLEGEQESQARALNRRVIEALRITWGMTHLETYLGPEGPLFGEIALRPPGGYIMELLRLAYGFDAWRAFVAIETELPHAFPAAAQACAAAIVLHPGAGRVVRIDGLERVRAHSCVVRARLRVAVGQRIAARGGLGEDVGYVLLRARDRAELLAAVAEVEGTLALELEPDPDPAPDDATRA